MDEQFGRSRAIIHISVLLTIAFCVGVYLIGTTTLIARDGITFIKYAKGFEVSPIKTIESEYQHPGYPFLITVAHKIAETGFDGISLQSWIYSAQAVTLIFRLLSIALLYFVGKKLVGENFSFWATLILVLLPAPAKFGSDTLSDWPHLFFLSAGFLLLILGAVSKRWWLFGFAGLSGGMGYLIRPECAQVVVFGCLWLILQIFWSKRIMSRGKAVIALMLLLVGFLVPALPYMKLKATVFPKKQLVRTAPEREFTETYEQDSQACSNSVYAAGFAPSDIAKALGKLIKRISETLMWFFVPGLLIGLYKYFRRWNWYEPERFFVAALIFLNVIVMVLLYCKYNYMSRRHTLPLVVFTIFYVPVGLQALASWLDEKFSKMIERLFAFKTNINFWFLVLLIFGISICAPKLLSPIRIEKRSYRDAAQWLAKNTGKNDIIAVSDARISFYAGRESINCENRPIPERAEYFAQVVKNSNQPPSTDEKLKVKKIFEDPEKESRVIIYRIH